jgi:hypothetical protein
LCSLRGVAYGVGDSLGELGGVAYLDAGIEAATVRASSDAVYWYFSLLVNDLPEARRTPGEILNAWTERFEPALRMIVSSTRDEDMRFDVLVQRDPLPVWGAGRVTLLGDAAYPLLPQYRTRRRTGTGGRRRTRSRAVGAGNNRGAASPL